MKDDIQVVGIKELKDNLSAYLKVIERGGRVLITNHGRVVGELCRPLSQPGMLHENALIHEWSVAERIRLPRQRSTMPSSPVRLPPGTAARLLEEDRAE